MGLPTQRVDRLEEFVTGAAVAEMSRAAESAGFDAVFVTEHPFPEKSWMDTGGHHALDPFVALSFAAAATTRIRLQTHLCVLPYRNPFLTAKSVASLDVLSGGRVILGAGTGYLEAEFAALGVDFAERNELTDEAIVAMKAAWSGEPLSLSSRHFDANDNFALPRPVQQPHPPIWIGGNSKRAIRRAVELADGWAPMPNSGPDGRSAPLGCARNARRPEGPDRLRARPRQSGGPAHPLDDRVLVGGPGHGSLPTAGPPTATTSWWRRPSNWRARGDLPVRRGPPAGRQSCRVPR